MQASRIAAADQAEVKPVLHSGQKAGCDEGKEMHVDLYGLGKPLYRSPPANLQHP